MKTCARCQLPKEETEFSVSRASPRKLSSYCKPCAALRRKEWLATHPGADRPHRILRKMEWRGVTFDKPVTAATARNRILRDMALDAYGGKCTCCGETTREFLTIEHIHGGGTKHRRDLHGTLIRWLMKRDWPKEGFTLLCYNCNCARGFYGYCPHVSGSKRLEMPVAPPPRKHPPHTAESKAKLRATRLGRHLSEETKQKISQIKTGVPKTPEHVAAMVEGRKRARLAREAARATNPVNSPGGDA